MIIGTLYNGGNCVYDLPIEIKTAAEFESLISGYNDGKYMERTREELLRVQAKQSQLSATKNLVDTSRNAPESERQPWDGLPALMMADQKGKI